MYRTYVCVLLVATCRTISLPSHAMTRPRSIPSQLSVLYLEPPYSLTLQRTPQSLSDHSVHRPVALSLRPSFTVPSSSSWLDPFHKRAAVTPTTTLHRSPLTVRFYCSLVCACCGGLRRLPMCCTRSTSSTLSFDTCSPPTPTDSSRHTTHAHTRTHTARGREIDRCVQCALTASSSSWLCCR